VAKRVAKFEIKSKNLKNKLSPFIYNSNILNINGLKNKKKQKKLW
jgi:hypothetical protein